MSSIQSGFSLIELLITMAIIATIATLIILFGAGPLMDAAKVSGTQRRMFQITSGLHEYQSQTRNISGQDGTLALISEANNRAIAFTTLRSIIENLSNEHAINIRDAKSDLHFPPNLGNRWEIDPTGAKWPKKDGRLETCITYLDRQITKKPRTKSQVEAHFNLIASSKAGKVIQTVLPDRVLFDLYWDIDSSGKASEDRYEYRNANISKCGEDIDHTREVKPDGLWGPTEYTQRWPQLLEAAPVLNSKKRSVIIPTGSSDAPGTPWPDSNWAATPEPVGDRIPIWPYPWGKKIISRFFGSQIEQTQGIVISGDPGAADFDVNGWTDPDTDLAISRSSPLYRSKARNLERLSPLASIILLRASGAINNTSNGAAQYRNNRSPSSEWNDRWGQPLIVGMSAFISPRYDYDIINDKVPFGKSVYGLVPRQTFQQFGGRDFFITAAKRIYGYPWSIYASIGAPGAIRDKSIKPNWKEDEDDGIFQAHWKNITLACAAWEWDQTSFDSPPKDWERIDPLTSGVKWSVSDWSKGGVREGKRANMRCFLTSPMELKP